MAEFAATDLTDAEINAMTHENAMRFFQYDPFSIRPREQCTVGALRAEAGRLGRGPALDGPGAEARARRVRSRSPTSRSPRDPSSMTTTPVLFDPYAYETHEDPYPIYRALRDDAPAYVDEERGFWALSRHDDVRAAIDDWHTFSSTGGITLERGADAVEPMLIEMDPPRHTEMRALVSRSFTPRRVAEMEAPTRELARELLADAGPHASTRSRTSPASSRWRSSARCSAYPAPTRTRCASGPTRCCTARKARHDITPVGIEGAMKLHGVPAGAGRGPPSRNRATT